METWEIGIGLAICLVLMFQRWFRFIALTMGSLAAGFELLASIMHFHIPSALGYAILMVVCWSLAAAMAGTHPPQREKVAQEMRPPSTDVDHPDWSPH